MRIALLTDIHANREAFAACLAHADHAAAERYVFLGDFVGYGADPGWVVDAVMAHVARGALAVLGNHDTAVAHGPRRQMRPEARQVIEWTRDHLNPEQLAFLAALPLSEEDGHCLFVHANAWAPAEWAYIDGTMEAGRSLRATERRYTFCGHMHEPMLYHMATHIRTVQMGLVGAFVPVPGSPIPLMKQRRWLAIPGSVGQPRDRNPAACYAVFDDESLELTYYRVPYDHDAAAAKVRAAGLPEDLAARLADGI
jgi:diadenosine tetraphosphatase ApaH/serine/threonine PP2A family protein phosphatase